MSYKFIWTAEAVEMTRSRYRAGDSATEIARDLSGGGIAVSRNAVLGKLHRLGELGERAAKLMAARGAVDVSIAGKSPAERGRAFNPKGKARPGEAAPARQGPKPRTPGLGWFRARREGAAVEPVGVTLDTLRPGQCRAPLWGHKDRPGGLSAPYCGAAVEAGPGGRAREGAVYCAGHARLFYEGHAA